MAGKKKRQTARKYTYRNFGESFLKKHRGLVPTLRGDPAWIFGHFGLSIARLSTRQSMGKSQKRPAADSSPSTLQKRLGKPACHEHVISIDMLARDHKQVRLENSKRSFRNRGGKITHKTQPTRRNFDVNSGRSGERYEAEIQQSTEYTFQYMSWAHISAMLEGLVGCGSLGITSRQRLFFVNSNTG